MRKRVSWGVTAGEMSGVNVYDIVSGLITTKLSTRPYPVFFPQLVALLINGLVRIHML